MAILGPTLIELSCQIETSLAHMSYAFTSRSIGYLTGSIVGGWLFDKYNGHVVLSLSCLWATLMMWVLPYVSSIYGLVVVIALLGVALGSLDTGLRNQILYINVVSISQIRILAIKCKNYVTYSVTVSNLLYHTPYYEEPWRTDVFSALCDSLVEKSHT